MMGIMGFKNFSVIKTDLKTDLECYFIKVI